jgi:hypothetical protein
MKISCIEESDTEYRKLEDLQNFVKKLNTSLYKQLVSNLKTRMDN